jgi:hypothetical protein
VGGGPLVSWSDPGKPNSTAPNSRNAFQDHNSSRAALPEYELVAIFNSRDMKTNTTVTLSRDSCEYIGRDSQRSTAGASTQIWVVGVIPKIGARGDQR